MANLDDLVVKPGPPTGSSQPTGAVNNGAMGGRPRAQVASAGGSPMERLANELPVATPPAPGTLPGPGQTPQASGGFAGSGTAPVATPPAQGAGITINVGAQPPQQAQPPKPGEMWPDAQAPRPGEMWPDFAAPQQAGGEMWPDARGQAPAPAPVPTAPTEPITFQRLPFDDELAMVPEGSVVRTPWGEGRVSGGKVRDYNLTPAGKEAHGRAMVKRVQEFGAHPWVNDPRAPQPPVELGRPAFNPLAPEGKGWSGVD